MEIVCTAQHHCHLSLFEEITHWCMNLRVMAAVELRVNATYYTQHPAFKSVYGKGLAVTDVKLFSFP